MIKKGFTSFCSRQPLNTQFDDDNEIEIVICQQLYGCVIEYQREKRDINILILD